MGKQEREKRDKIRHIAFTKSEIERIETYRKNSTQSQFIRLAVDEKINRIKAPELFKESINIGFDKEFLKETLKDVIKEEIPVDLIFERMDIFSEIMNTLKDIKPRVNGVALKEKTKVVEELLVGVL